MAYDLLVKNGRVVDGSGMPSYKGDVGVKNGKIVQIGKLSGPAEKVIDADGLVTAPGFVDNHCHFDAQVTWDPLCSFACYHGATTVIIGNCSLALAPVRPGTQGRLAELLSYVEAIPMDVLETIDFSWETVPQYMDTIGQRLGVNVGCLVGHSAVRYYVMGDECQRGPATKDEIEAMRRVVGEAITAGALGLSFDKQKGHFDPQGVPLPAVWATEEEIFALGDVLRELGTGIIQGGGGRETEMNKNDRLYSRLSQATGRQVIFNHLGQHVAFPNGWKDLMAIIDENSAAGARAYPLCLPKAEEPQFTMRNCQLFKNIPSWAPIQIASDEQKLQAYRDPEVRKRLHAETVDWSVPISHVNLARNWYDHVSVWEPVLEKNQKLKGKTIGQIAREQGMGVIDAFLDLAVEEDLDTIFVRREENENKEAMAQILNYPKAVIGLSDGGAHVQFQSFAGYSTHFLGYWVREQKIMSLEQAVRRLTFDSASVFGIYDRGLLRPGLAADMTIFDPETVSPLPQDVVRDFPAGGWRVRELAQGVKCTIVNGQVLIEDGKHTGALPGRIMRNTLYQAAER
jgi:N-acyl-D-aspartate/D-glutamate deacylase